MVTAVLAVCVGAALGALARWGLAEALNARWPLLPPGTLLANLIGGYLVGVAVGVFAQWPALSPAWRLFAITGFLGGFTTFSSFSAETVGLLQQGRAGWALATAAAHVGGSLLLTWAGLATALAFRR